MREQPMKKIKLLFQGDSITDADRDRSDYHNLGLGYALHASEMLKEAYPEVDFEFVNLGLSGNRTDQLFDRITPDRIEIKPDIISILIGINDIWHRYEYEFVPTRDEQIALNYRCILDVVKESTNAKLLMLQPFTEGNDQAFMRPDVDRVIPIVDSLAEKYADAYIRLDEIIHADENYGTEHYFTRDGVHPNETGAEFIAKLYVEAISPLIDEILSNK